MFALYECPECHRIHDEPSEPAYAIAVRCFDCALEIELHARRALVPAMPQAA